MKACVLMFIGFSLLLVGCQSQATTDPSTTTTAATEGTQTNLIYFQHLVDKYQIAVEHAKSHENVQSPLAALVIAYDELKQAYPSDAPVINKHYADLQAVLNWDGEAWKTSFTKWADELKQSYEQIEHTYFDKQNDFISLLQKTTVKQKRVNWNVFGSTDTNDYDYLVLDAYQDVKHQHVYLFTVQAGQPVVLYANSTMEHLANKDFELTQNQELTHLFHRFSSSTDTYTDDVFHTIETAMSTYTSDSGEHYHMASPATQRDYYGLASPDQVVKYGKVNGKVVTFKWNEWVVGDGDAMYDVQACYVNDSGTEVLLFCYHDGSPVVLRTIGEPDIQTSASGTITSATVNFEEWSNISIFYHKD